MNISFLPGDYLCVSPEIVQIVILPRIVAEKMNDHIHKIGHDPRLSFMARAAKAFEAALLTEFDDLIADSAHLPRAGAVGQHEIIRHRRQPGQVQYRDAMGPRTCRQARRIDRKAACFAVAGRVALRFCCRRRDNSPPVGGEEV